jgi:hypothetical protein
MNFLYGSRQLLLHSKYRSLKEIAEPLGPVMDCLDCSLEISSSREVCVVNVYALDYKP